MLRPRENARTRERILVIGLYGSGKSRAWACLRQWYEATGTPGHFHIISTEYEMADRTAEAYPNFDSNATIQEATDWSSLVALTDAVLAVANPEDWLIIDSIGNANLWARDAYTRKTFGTGFKDYMAQGGKASEIGPTGWLEIDGLYRSWMVPVTQSKLHKLACAQADTVNTQGSWADSAAIQKMYGRVGVKPVGHKELGYNFHTVLHLYAQRQGEWRVTTVDDPERPHLVDEPIADFVTTYLLPVANWRVD